MQGINDLGFPTINGLKSLNLDTLDTTILNANTIDGNIIYYNKIEGNEIIVDTKLTLTNTGVIAVGDKFISDIELTYLDGVSSNIQTQINNINTNNSALVTTVNLHTTQITALQAKDIIHTNQIGILQDEVVDLYASDAVLFANIATLSDKTMFQTRNSTATIFSNQVDVPNGNIGFYNSLLPNNFYIQSNLASGNNIVLNAGLANIFLQSQNVYLGKSDATTGRKSNLHFYNFDGNAYEIQSSAFTENLKLVLIDNAYSDVQQNIKIADLEESDGIQNGEITTLENKTQYITTDANSTIFSKQINIPNGNIGFYNSSLPNNFYIKSNLASGNNIILNAGLANIDLQTQNVYLGKTDATTGRKSNLHFYNSAGDAYEIQSSAFTESLRSTVISDSYNVLQQQISITALENKTQNINSTTNATSTNMNKPLRITTNGECLRTIGNHTYWAGYDTTNTTRHFAIGKEGITSNRLMISNNTLGETVIQAGSRTGNTNLGQNKIITNSNGISLRRGGITAGDTQITVGEIGGINTDAHLYINGNGTNNITIDTGLGACNLITNALWVGSSVASANGRKSNINMLDASGNNWETQSSAFTETLKSSIITTSAKFTNASSFGVNKGKISLSRNFEIMGQTSLSNATTYNSGTAYNVGAQLNSSYPTIFDTNGKFNGSETMNFNISFELGFLCKTSSMKYFKSYIQILDTNGSPVDNTFTQGIDLISTGSTLHNVIYYSVGPFKHIILTGHQIILSTSYNFMTSNVGGYAMDARITIERNPL